ncbi:MAG: alpha/beta fold hydrolase [Acetobacter syzygii]|uniref:alpha/beta fold hydrolase n=1 Tax=Acetobacter syzygii TaxID=146476 RepID=UPI0039EADEFB
MPVQPVFVHGWGFGPDFWTPLLAALGWTDACVLDLGFVGQGVNTHAQAMAQVQAVQAQGRPMLGIGHSLGFLWLAQHMEFSRANRLVGINAFAAFAARPDFTAGVPARVLQRMVKGLSSRPEQVLADFRGLCGAGEVEQPFCIPNLQKGLELLVSGDVRSRLAGIPEQYCVLAARQDPVVSPAMTEESFAGGPGVQWLDGGHMLPHTHLQDCVAFLQDAREKMEQRA